MEPISGTAVKTPAVTFNPSIIRPTQAVAPNYPPSLSHDATVIFCIFKNSNIMSSPTRDGSTPPPPPNSHTGTHNLQKIEGLLHKTSGPEWGISRFLSSFSFSATAFIYQKTRRCPTAIILWIVTNLFLEHDYGSLNNFPPGKMGSALCKVFLFLCARMAPCSKRLAQEAAVPPFCSSATCKHTKLHL